MVMISRHAYLIICHTNFEQLNILLDLLDDERNDVFLHIDKKAKGFSIETIKSHAVHARLFFVKPIHVNWAGDSLVKVEIKLLTEATKTRHDYYHLISGMDLPLKSQNELHSFFTQNAGFDYVALEREHLCNITKSFMDRVNYYYLFQNHIKRGSNGIAARLQRVHIRMQKTLKINRNKQSSLSFQKGSQWFSITHDTACYLLDEFKKVKKSFRYTFAPDELFLQTILMQSPQIDKIIDDNLRYIDWERGNPYTFKQEDYTLLMNSNKLFARKFDTTVDQTIILKIRDGIHGR